MKWSVRPYQLEAEGGFTGMAKAPGAAICPAIIAMTGNGGPAVVSSQPWIVPGSPSAKLTVTELPAGITMVGFTLPSACQYMPDLPGGAPTMTKSTWLVW